MKTAELGASLKDLPWNDGDFSPGGNGLWRVPTMLTVEEGRMLSYLTEHVYTGTGEILDLGCFLGGSTAFLAHGLSKNSYRGDFKVRSFDLFQLGNFERQVFFPRRGLEPPEDGHTFEMHKKFTEPWAESIVATACNILDYEYVGSDIEILFIDLMKSSQIYDHVISQFLPRLIPGQSVLILQDLLFEKSGAWHPILVELLKEKLEPIGQTKANSALYACTQRITKDDINRCLWDNIDDDTRIISVAQNAIGWDDPRHRRIVLEILESYMANRPSWSNKGTIYNRLGRSGN